jgi:hypothetical protein
LQGIGIERHLWYGKMSALPGVQAVSKNAVNKMEKRFCFCMIFYNGGTENSSSADENGGLVGVDAKAAQEWRQRPVAGNE